MLDVQESLLVPFVERAYAQDGNKTEWAEQLLAAFAPIVGGRSAVFHRMKSVYGPDGALRLTDASDFVAIGTDAIMGVATAENAIRQPAHAFERTRGAPLSESTGAGAALPTLPGFRDCWHAPIVEVVGLWSREANGDLTVVGCGLDRMAVLSPRERRLLMRLATHLGAAHRLRRFPSPTPLDAAEAVLSPRGKLVHACDAAKTRREALDDGHRRRTVARRAKQDGEKALEIWQGLVAGRWSLVDHFDTDGKRFVLAMKNAPAVEPRANLTPHERRVAALAAMGHRDKEIAYTLGVSLASVSTALHRARRKLGATSRAALAATWRKGN